MSAEDTSDYFNLINHDRSLGEKSTNDVVQPFKNHAELDLEIDIEKFREFLDENKDRDKMLFERVFGPTG